MGEKRNVVFLLSLLDPPRIKGSGVTAQVSVVVNNVLELHCEASGIPTPSLTWLKDGRPLPQTDSLHLLQGGEMLRAASAQVSVFAVKSHVSYVTFHINSTVTLIKNKTKTLKG